MDDDDRIVATADTPAGKPRIKGTRIAVDPIAGWLADGWSFEQILESYPNITSEDILAVQGFASQRKDAMSMCEIHFIVEEPCAVGADIFTEADDRNGLEVQERDALHCHFDEDKEAILIRRHSA